MKNLKRKIRKNAKRILASFLLITTVMWSFGPSLMTFTPTAKAAGGINVMYVNDAGATPDTFLDDTVSRKAFLEINVFEETGGTLNSISVCLDEMNGFVPATDLTALTLWQDDGDGISTPTDEDGDTLLSTVTSFTTLVDAYAMGGTCSQVTFSGLALSIPISWSSQMRLFVAAQAKANLNENPMHSFNPMIPVGGIDVTVSGATIADWPSGMNAMFPPVFLGTEGAGGMFSPLLISEIQVDGGSDDDEFVELYNRSPEAIVLSAENSFTLTYEAAISEEDLETKTNWDASVVLNSGTIPANGFMLIGGSNGTGYDYGATVAANATFSTPFTLPEAGGIVGLFSPGNVIIDKVAYGNAVSTQAEGSQSAPAPAANGSIERKAFSDSTASKMAAGGIHEIKGNSEDTNNNAMDFIIKTTSVPQNISSTAESNMGTFDEGISTPVLINEVFYNTSTGQGWIELYNRSGGAQAMAGWKIVSNTKTYTIPADTSIAAGAFAVVHWNSTEAEDTVTDLYTSNSNGTTVDGNMGTLGGDVLLKDGGDAVKDYVQYGGAGKASESAAVTAYEWMTGDYVPNCLYSQSIGRRSTTGDDFNGSGDWQPYSSTSAGFSNMGGDSTAPTAVTSVTLTDNDETASSGLNGDDIRIVWTPSTTPDSSFDRYAVYLLPATTVFDDALHSPIDRIYGGQYQYSEGVPLATFTYDGDGSITKDSAGSALSAGDYKAYIIAVDFAGNRSGSAVSAMATLTAETYDAGSDTQKPFIMHMGAWQAKAGVDLVLMARFEDDRALDATNPAQVIYKVNAGAWQAAVDCTLVESSFYACTIPGTTLTGDDTVSYYLKAKDAATTPNIRFISASAEVDMATYADNATYETAVQGVPFVVDILAADGDAYGDYTDDGADADLTGYVYSSDGNPINGARVFLEGFAAGYVSTGADGSFSIPDNTMYPGSFGLVAFEDNYMNMFLNVFKGESVSFYLNQGDMNMMSGTDMPFVTWTAPGPGMMGVQTDIYCTSSCTAIGSGEMPIIIGFSKPMNANTINDLDASNAGSNIYLTTSGNDRVSGKVYYDSVMNEARFYTSTHDVLLPNTFYNIVVTQGVTDNDGNPISGNNSDGSFNSGFVTMSDNTDFWGVEGIDYTTYADSGIMMPPYVTGVNPGPGAFNVSPNASMIIEFSEPMSSLSISTSSVKLYPVTNESTWTLGSAIAATVTLDQATQKIITLNPSSDLPANADNHGWYVMKIMGSVKSTAGIWFGNPSICGAVSPDTCLLIVPTYESSFQVSATTDIIAPTVVASHPNNNTGITVGTTPVDVGIAAIEIGFSEPMNPTTITAQNITLASGSNSVTGSVKYDPMGNMAKFIPANTLNANTQYTLTVSTSVTDLAGVPFDSASTVVFKTGIADVVSPTLIYANGDDYTIAVTYSEPMNSAGQTNTTRWGTSVLNPENYFIKTVDFSSVAAAPYSTVTALSSISGLSFTYDEGNNTVVIEGFNLFASSPYPADYQIFVDLVTDRSNNVITNSTGRLVSGSNATQGPIQNSTDTYGILGPGTYDPMMDMGTMGMMMAGAFPMNAMAGQTSMYFVDVPTTKSIPVGGTIVLTFPSGFDVSNAIKDPYSPINNDINEWNTGTITIASVTKNQTSRTITITTGGAATQTTDFLHMDIKGIINSSVPRDFGTEGYLVDIKTFSDVGVLLESITTMPFFITQGGSYTLSGTVTMRNGNNTANVNIDNAETMTVYLGSPMTGPMEATVTFDGDHNANFSFANLPVGEYHLFTEPAISVNISSTSTDFNGYMKPDPIWVNETTDLSSDSTDNNIIDRDFILTQIDASSGTAVTVSLTGNFSTNSVADNVDIFAGSPSGFRVKTLTSVGIQSGDTYTFYLPDGDWMVGIGPAVPVGPMAGPVPMPDWMPPMSINVKVANPAVIENSGTANDGIISFDISSQISKTVTGTVVNGSGTGIADVEVYAYQPLGGFGGSFTKTSTDGSFTLKIPVLGTYKIGAQKPGLPSSSEKTVEVQDNVTGVSLVLQMPSYTISGKVLNASSQAVAYAPVWAYQSDGSGNANTMTDSAGNYILYVNNGTWIIEADAPGVGWMQYDLPITINNASQASKNLKPATDTVWVTISGTITINDVLQSYRPIRAVAYDVNGNYLGREYSGMTDSSGVYSISVPGIASGLKYYRVDIWTPDFGEVGLTTDAVANSPANITVGSSNVTGANITIASGALNTVTIQFSNKADYPAREAYINIDGVTYTGVIPTPTGFHKSLRVSDIAGADSIVQLADGDYHFFVDVPGYGGYIPSSTSTAFDETKKAITIDGTGDTVIFALPDLDDTDAVITISGTVSGPAVGQKDAWVWVGNPATGFHSGEQADASDGTYSLTVPILASGNYMVGADKQGYLSGNPTANNGTADATINFSLTAQTSTIAGRIFADISGGTADIYDSGEEIANGWVRAKNTTTGAEANAPVDGSGNYILGVMDGTWKIYGSANGYSESQYKENGLPSILTVAGSNLTGKNIELNVNANWTNKTKSSPITPASGGVVDDTAQNTSTGKASGTGVKITLPPNALGSSTSSGNVSSNETSAVSATDSMKPINNTGKAITATDNSGQPITNLDNYIDMEIVTYKADIDEASNLTDNTKLKTAKIGYWDDTLNQWVNLPTTKKVYYKDDADTDWTLYNGTDTQSGFEEFIDDALGVAPTFVEGTDYDDYKIVATASTNHLTVFALGTSPDGVAPAAPTGLVQSSGSGTSNLIAWDTVSTNSDTTTLTDLYGYAVYRSTDGTTYSQINTSAIPAGTITYTDSTTTAFTSYYYKVTAGDDDDLESAYSTAVQMCSTSTVDNGTINAGCSITCNAGYSLSGNSCIVAGGGGGGSSVPSSSTGQAAATPSAGGTISKTNSDGTSAKVELPAGALLENATITISPKTKASITASRPISAGNSVVGNYVYNFTAVSGLNIAVNTFEKALTLTFTYTNGQAEGIDEGTLKIYYWDDTLSQWVALTDSAVNTTNNTVTATTTHFTYFAILGTQTSEETTTPTTPSTEVVDGDIIQAKSSDNPFAVYIVKVVGDTKYIRHIVSLEIFNYYGHLDWNNLKQVDSLAPYSLSGWVRVNTGPNGTPGPNDKVYEINGDQSKHWINMTAEEFLAHGGSDAAIYSVNQGELNLYTTGPDVMSL